MLSELENLVEGFEESDIQNEIMESIPFAIIDDLSRNRKITADEAILLRKRYGWLYTTVKKLQFKEQQLQKKSRVLANETLSDKIVLDKSRLMEMEHNQRLKRLEGEKDNEISMLDTVAQKHAATKFELTELKKIHDEVAESLENMVRDNKHIVEPVLEKFKQEIEDINNQLEVADVAISKEEIDKKAVLKRQAELEEILATKREEHRVRLEELVRAELQPVRHARTTENIKSAIKHLESQLLVLQKGIQRRNTETANRLHKKQEAEKLKKHLEEQLELHHLTLEKRIQDVSLLRQKVDIENDIHHDLVTKKVELNLKKKEVETNARYFEDHYNILIREYEGHKRLYKKKLSIADSTRSLLPELELQLQDAEILLQNYKKDEAEAVRRCSSLKDTTEDQVQDLLEQENVEKGVGKDLEVARGFVEELEAEINRLLAEDKRLSKLNALLSTQRDASLTERTRLLSKNKEAKQLIRMKELIVIDLTKRCTEISNRHKEFSALYELVKNERNKYSATILSSQQALAEMREKIRILTKEIDILIGEGNAKSSALARESSSHHIARTQRDKLKEDMNILLSEYRAKQREVETQIQEIDKDNAAINSLEKTMLQLKRAYEKVVEERNTIGIQLIDRNDEICVVQERWRQYQQAMKTGEDTLFAKEQELRMLRLQSDELRRQYRSATLRLPELDVLKSKLEELERELKNERSLTMDYGSKLEDPQYIDRWRPLEGDDPTLEQLNDKILLLEQRQQGKRDQLLEKGLVLEEVVSLIEKLREQALVRKNSTSKMADQLNELQNKIRDATTKMLVSVSELSMYQATALRLQEEKVARLKEFEDAKWRVEHGEAPSEDAKLEFDRAERRRQQTEHSATSSPVRFDEMRFSNSPFEMKKSTVEPRPTAYIPDEIGLPKPYGAQAPFKPSDTAASRLVRQPQPKVIEI